MASREKQAGTLAGKVAALLRTYSADFDYRQPLSFEDLKITGLGSGEAIAQTVSSLPGSVLRLFDPRAYRQKQSERTILSEFNGSINPGEMVLVIGQPGSGCTTLLKSLAGLHGEYHDVQGRLKYGGAPYGGDTKSSVLTTFCAEEDDHLPTLSVEETLRFAVEATWPSTSPKETKETATSELADLVGLSHVLGTRVGSASIRGVSGGERRRVSLAEAIATQADILCLDNPTNGLDSSTALEFIEMMREYTKQSRSTTVMSVYQGSDAMIPLFDKVIVVSKGRQIFFGPMMQAKPYFEELGHPCPATSTVTDYLTSMTSSRLPVNVDKDAQSLPPASAEELEKVYRLSSHRKQMKMDMEAIRDTPFPALPSERRQFSLPMWRQIYLITKRQFRVLVTNYHNWLIEAACIVVQSLAIGTLFRDQPRETKAFFILACSLFFCVLVPALQAMAEFSNTFATRELVLRQKQYGFYRPMSYALGLALTDMIWKVVVIGYNIPQYFLTGFQYDAGKFFTWFFVLYVEHMALSMIIRNIATSSRTMSWAVLPVGVIFNMMVLYTGLFIPPPTMQVWLYWLRYLNPMYYAFESVMVNEFADLAYLCSTTDLAPYGQAFDSISNQVCAVAGAVTGEGKVSGANHLLVQYGFEASHLWRNVGINLGLFVIFAVSTGVGMEWHKPPAGRAATVYFRKKDLNVEGKDVSSVSEMEKGGVEASIHTSGVLGTGEDKLNRMATHQGRTLMWKNLSLDIEFGREKKRLLDDLSGFIQPRQLTALMGVSGAGKTTLLNVLAGRIEAGHVSGDLFIDGSPLPKSFRRLMGYVQQQDIHLPTQTVREALKMTARLRRPKIVSLAEKDAYVETVISVLELNDLAEALIGTPGAGLSLEQRKRVSIGVELAAHPEVLFLDEPTSGLDGQSALNIVRLLRKLADSGQTVLCTIHQPAGEVISTFDHLVLLVKGGQLAYDGPLGNDCTTAVNYFQGISKIGCGSRQNPAEYILDIVGAGSRSSNTTNWGSEWLQTKSASDRQQQLQELLPADGHECSSDLDVGDTYAASFLGQMAVVLRRAWLYNWRDTDYFIAKLFMFLANGLLNGLSYLNSSSPSNVSGAYNMVLSAFFSMIVGPPLGLQTEARFVALRDIFLLRDKSAMSYSWVVMVLSAIIVELPYGIAMSFGYWVLWYFPVGYSAAPGRAGYSFLIYELFSVFVLSLAQLVSSIMPNLESAFMANGFFFMFLNTLSGVLSPRSVTPSGWSWYYDLNPLFYFGEGMITTIMEGFDIECSEKETFSFIPPGNSSCIEYAGEWLRDATGYVMNPDALGECQYCRYTSGESYYRQYEWEFSNRWRDVGIFIGFIAFNYTAVLVLMYLTKVRRWHKH